MKKQKRKTAFTLLEVLVTMALLSLVASTIYATLISSTSTFTNNSRMGSIQENARGALDTMANEIRMADQKTLVLTGPTTGGPNAVTFVTPTGILNGVVTWGSQITYQLQPAAQLVNGASDATAMNIVRLQAGSFGGLPQRICDFVSPNGLQITRNGNNLVITLTLAIQDETLKTIQTTLQTSVTLRNSS